MINITEAKEIDLDNTTYQTFTAEGYRFLVYWSAVNSLWFLDAQEIVGEDNTTIPLEIKGVALTTLNYNLFTGYPIGKKIGVFLLNQAPALQSFIEKRSTLLVAGSV